MQTVVIIDHCTTQVPLVPLKGYNDRMMIRCDPETHYIDVKHAFELVFGKSPSNTAMSRVLNKVYEEGKKLTSSIEISKLAR